MGNTLTQADLRMTYLSDPFAIEAIDQDQVIQELSSGAEQDDPARWLGRRLFTDYHHLVLANDRYGRSLAVLGVRDGTTPKEDFLFLDTGFVSPALRGRGLLRRMIALVILRAAREGPAPQVIAARTCNPVWFRMLRGFAGRFTECSFFPQTDEPAVNLSTAALAQRIARQIGGGRQLQISSGVLRGGYPTLPEPAENKPSLSRDPVIDALFGQELTLSNEILTVLDLRAETEEAIIETARTVYRKR
jgi:GNAT superfamily N-acetyltransferase